MDETKQGGGQGCTTKKNYAFAMKDGVTHEKSYAFAIRVVMMVKYLQQNKNERIMSKQVLRSGTAIGALLSEAKFAQSTADFIIKLKVALKEANETCYWLNLLKDTEYIDEEAFRSMENDAKEIIALLVSSLKTIEAKAQL